MIADFDRKASPWDSGLSLAVDRAVLGIERNRGLLRWLWRVRLSWLTRNLP